VASPHPLRRGRQRARAAISGSCGPRVGFGQITGSCHGALGPRSGDSRQADAKEQLEFPASRIALDHRGRAQDRAARGAGRRCASMRRVLPRRGGRHGAEARSRAQTRSRPTCTWSSIALRRAARGVELWDVSGPQHQRGLLRASSFGVRTLAALHQPAASSSPRRRARAAKPGTGVLPLRRAEEGMARWAAEDPDPGQK